jgi:tRNA(adenine34) deaminase
MTALDEHYMEIALEEAHCAGDRGEVPVGALIVKDGDILARGHNRKEKRRDPTAHAEILAIRRAARRLGGWRLDGSVLYVTLEPCPMCLGAIKEARISGVVFGCKDPRLPFGRDGGIHTESGVKEGECRRILKDFFLRLRGSRHVDAFSGLEAEM